MKLRDSLAENKSIRLQAEAETWQDAVKIGVDLLVAADVVAPLIGSAGGGGRCRAALLPGDSGWRGTVWPLFRYRSGAGDAARAAGRGR